MTKLCLFWQQGKCKRDRCVFAHGDEDLSVAPDFTKTSLCNFQKRGFCHRTPCTFARSKLELRGHRPTPLSTFAHGSTLAHFEFDLRERRPTSLSTFAHGSTFAHSELELRECRPTLSSTFAYGTNLWRPDPPLPPNLHAYEIGASYESGALYESGLLSGDSYESGPEQHGMVQLVGRLFRNVSRATAAAATATAAEAACGSAVAVGQTPFVSSMDYEADVIAYEVHGGKSRVARQARLSTGADPLPVSPAAQASTEVYEAGEGWEHVARLKAWEEQQAGLAAAREALLDALEPLALQRATFKRTSREGFDVELMQELVVSPAAAWLDDWGRSLNTISL